MPHKASHSVDSISSLSSLSSLSSESSVQLYEKRLKPEISAIQNSSATLQELVDTATNTVNEVFAVNPKSIFTYKGADGGVSVHLDKVMLAMLAFAGDCGGESGQRYVAAAISSCLKEEDVVGALAGLGITWLTHLLFVFKASRGHANQLNKTPSEVATPTIDVTVTHLMEGVGPRQKSFRDDVIKRDGYACILTGSQDNAHPKPAEDIPILRLEAAHILCRGVGRFDKDKASDSYQSALTTFDILRNFTRLPARTLEELSAELDHPSNGVTLELNCHVAFDNFYWCLKKTEIEDVYDLEVLRPQSLPKKPEFSRITFEDRSKNFSDPTRNLRRKHPIDLPNARYIEIHAAIAGILHMSGAGKFFDELLDNDKEDRDKVSGVRCWPELEKLMEERSLRDSLTESFQLARVH
ncbi:hypothetical protein D9619_009581 [Psilocybe cf. subviscida]|uniref:HNH nuclease domain-containing protein n=1 Tax=Psilocybe cf. subviscida TaxID=2480587 RepID=A0A8H5BKT6_9AGAR|nr:hypothetical protein D9619_009581 [Psilocybe cf. subviscida]